MRNGEAKPDVAKVRERMGSLELPPLEQPVEDLAGITITDKATGGVNMVPRKQSEDLEVLFRGQS